MQTAHSKQKLIKALCWSNRGKFNQCIVLCARSKVLTKHMSIYQYGILSVKVKTIINIKDKCCMKFSEASSLAQVKVSKSFSLMWMSINQERMLGFGGSHGSW